MAESLAEELGGVGVQQEEQPPRVSANENEHRQISARPGHDEQHLGLLPKLYPAHTTLMEPALQPCNAPRTRVRVD